MDRQRVGSLQQALPAAGQISQLPSTPSYPQTAKSAIGDAAPAALWSLICTGSKSALKPAFWNACNAAGTIRELTLTNSPSSALCISNLPNYQRFKTPSSFSHFRMDNQDRWAQKTSTFIILPACFIFRDCWYWCFQTRDLSVPLPYTGERGEEKKEWDRLVSPCVPASTIHLVSQTPRVACTVPRQPWFLQLRFKWLTSQYTSDLQHFPVAAGICSAPRHSLGHGKLHEAGLLFLGF